MAPVPKKDKPLSAIVFGLDNLLSKANVCGDDILPVLREKTR